MGADLVRRLIDVAGSSVGLVLFSPLLALVAAAVKADSHGPVLHVAKRVGKDGKPFGLYKFRSMVAGAERLGPGLTTADDRRITRVGRFLRATKLDELPQLINVLRGDMSLVGPRPEDPRYVALYTRDQRQALRVRPGITGAASLAYRNEASLLDGEDWERRYVHEILPHKLKIELDYLARRTLTSDLKLIALTLLGLGRLEFPAREPRA
jgi:lipopolysaccharide/colanic/teichoic acid biosynthesis glycosyltransferase